MTTSGRFWPTPAPTHVDGHDYERDLERKRAMKQGPRNTVTNLSAVVLASTSSPEASPASPSAPPENDRAAKMTAISGRNLRELFDPPGPVTAFLRMCRESSVWRVGLTGYSLTWVRAATPQGRSLSRLRLSAPTTGATGSGLWPSMVERDAGSYGHGMLPTAAASDYKGSSEEGQRRGQLSEVVAGQKLSAAWVNRLQGYPDGWMDLED